MSADASRPMRPPAVCITPTARSERTDPGLRDVKLMRAALDRNPNDLALGARLAWRAIEAARETGDPRFLGQAQAALLPWWNLVEPPAQALLLRATIKQSTHD